MGLLKVGGEQRPVHLVLNKNQQKNIKRGSPWIYSDALRELPPAPAGSLALLKTKEGDILAKGAPEASHECIHGAHGACLCTTLSGASRNPTCIGLALTCVQVQACTTLRQSLHFEWLLSASAWMMH